MEATGREKMEDSGEVELFPIIEVNGPESGVIKIPIADSTTQEIAMRYWDRVVLLHRAGESAEDRLQHDNQWDNPVEVMIHGGRTRTAADELRNFRPVDVTDANGLVHELNTDPDEVQGHYQAWLDEKDRPV